MVNFFSCLFIISCIENKENTIEEDAKYRMKDYIKFLAKDFNYDIKNIQTVVATDSVCVLDFDLLLLDADSAIVPTEYGYAIFEKDRKEMVINLEEELSMTKEAYKKLGKLTDDKKVLASYAKAHILLLGTSFAYYE